MESDFRKKERKGYVMMRMTYDLTMAILILGMGIFMLFGSQFRVAFVQELDPIIRYLFGALCMFYGGFRLYRGIKRDY